MNYFNNPMGQMGQMTPQMPNPYQFQPPKQTSNVEWIKVDGVSGARSVQVENGKQAWMLDTNRDVFYVKDANNMGICTLKAYRFEEIGLDEPNTAQATYVTKKEFEALKNEIRALQEVNNEQSYE